MAMGPYNEQAILELRAAIGNAAGAVGDIDKCLVMLLGNILHPPPMMQQDLQLAS